MLTVYYSMKKTKTTFLVRELIRMGMDHANAYRIVNLSKGQAAKYLIRALTELLELKAEIQRKT